MTFSVAIIGSFRRHYDIITRTVEEFSSLGVRINSPVISRIINPGASYVRFVTDPRTPRMRLSRRRRCARSSHRTPSTWWHRAAMSA